MESTFTVEFPDHEIESKWEYDGSPVDLARQLFGEIAGGIWIGFGTDAVAVENWRGDISYWGRRTDTGLSQVCMSTPRDGQYLVVPKTLTPLSFPASVSGHLHPPLLRYEPRFDRLLSPGEFASYVSDLVCVGTLTRYKYMFFVRSMSDRIYNLVVDHSVFRDAALKQVEIEYKRVLGSSAADDSGATILDDYERMHRFLMRSGIRPSTATKFDWLLRQSSHFNFTSGKSVP